MQHPAAQPGDGELVRVSYLAANDEPLIASGQMMLLDEKETEIVPGIWVEPMPGHTASMPGVHLESAGQHVCYPGDLVPTAHHVDATWGMGYDLDPLTCIEQRKRFLQRAMDGDWRVLFPHDHHTPVARLVWNDKGKPVVRGTSEIG